jgi:hypothetical protein
MVRDEVGVGRNGATNWTTLDRQADVAFENRTQTKRFEITEPNYFEEYRLSILDVQARDPNPAALAQRRTKGRV